MISKKDILEFQRKPIAWAKVALQENLWEKQKEIFRSVRDNRRTAVKTCHAIGKTRVAADIALWFFQNFVPSEVITTAPTWRQVNDLLWGEIRERYHGAQVQLAGQIFKTPDLKAAEKWFIKGLSTNEHEKFQGYHEKNILILVAEARGVEEEIFVGIQGIMTGGNVRLLLIGNPTKNSGEFYDAFHEKSKIYNTISVGAFDTPNLAPHKFEYDKLVNRQEKIDFLRGLKPVHKYLIDGDFVADTIESYSEDSSVYEVKVLGEFPKEDPYQLIPLHLIEAAENRWENLQPKDRWWEWEEIPWRKVHVACDVARFGSDSTVIASHLNGVFAPLITINQMDTMSVAGTLISIAHQYRAGTVLVDVIGIGAGVYDRCAEEKLYGAIPISIGEGSEDPNFLNIRAQYYWHLRQCYERGLIATPKGSKVKGQLSTMKYKHNSAGKLQIESKETMKRRGLQSPDEADAVMMAMIPIDGDDAGCGFDAYKKDTAETSGWNEPTFDPREFEKF